MQQQPRASILVGASLPGNNGVDLRRSILASCCSDDLKRASRAQLRKSRLVAEETFVQRRRRQLGTGRLFEDPDFPAEASSLFPSRPDCGTEYKWRRPRDINPAPRFVSKAMSRFDIRQGELKDCWLLAAVASLSLHRRLLERVVSPSQSFGKDYCGMFRFRFWQFGEWRDVVIDDRLPTRGGKLCFMRSQEANEFWSALLEKAYAKLNGSYEALSGGSQAEAMEDLTGGLCESFDLGKPPGDLWQILLQACSSHSLMGCCIDSPVAEGVLANRLITGHAYSVTDVRWVALTDGSRQRLVRLRNPWGNEFEWTGAWGDRSPEWDRVGPAEKQQLGLEVGDDGEFWMAYEDFEREFSKMEVCRLSPDAMFEDASGSANRRRRWEMALEAGEWVANVSAGGCRNFIASFHTNPQFRVEIAAADDSAPDRGLGSLIVGLMQKDVRRLAGGGHFHSIGYCVYSLGSRSLEAGPLDEAFFRTNRFVARSAFADVREVCGRHRLQPGSYAVIPSTFRPNGEAQFILRIFTERPSHTECMDSCSCVGCEGQQQQQHQHQEAATAGQARHSTLLRGPEPTDQLHKAFVSFSGPSRRISARQLQQVLNVTYCKEIKSFAGFSLDASRSLLALADADVSGTIAYDEFKQLWTQIRQFRRVFKEFDADNTGCFDAFRLREAMKLAGLVVSNKVYHAVAIRYTDREKGLVAFDDFVVLCVRLRIAFESFGAMPKCDEEELVGMVNHDNYLEQTVYI